MSDEILSYAPYTENSYWVYRLKNDTSVIDTLKCIDVHYKYNDYNDGTTYGGAGLCTKIFYAKLQHSNRDYFNSLLDSSDPGYEQFRVLKGAEERIELERILFPGKRGGGYFYWLNPVEKEERYSSQLWVSKIDTAVIIDNVNYPNQNLISLKTIKERPAYERRIDSIFLEQHVGMRQYNEGILTWQLIGHHIQ